MKLKLLLCVAWAAVAAAQDTCDCNDDGLEDPGSGSFYFFLFGSVILILISGVMSGLTVGYMSLPPDRLAVLAKSGRPKEMKYAKRVLPLLDRHNLLLATLVLANSAAAQTLPLFFDRIVPTYLAIILSVTAILFMGEIIPQAVCTGPNRLPITATFVWFVRVLIWVFFIVAYPISVIMDKFLGDEQASKFRRVELKELIAAHGPSTNLDKDGTPIPAAEPGSEDDDDADSTKPGAGVVDADHIGRHEVAIIHGALDLRTFNAKDVMKPWDNVFGLDYGGNLDMATMASIISHGHSRVPVFKGGRQNAMGYLLVKRIITVDPDDSRPIAQFSTRVPLVIRPETNLLAVLRKFLKKGVRIGFVATNASALRAAYRACGSDMSGFMKPEEVDIVGLLTVEDVIEKLLQEDLRDEHDMSIVHNLHLVEKAVDSMMSKDMWVKLAKKKFLELAGRATRRVAARKRLALKEPAVQPADAATSAGAVVSPANSSASPNASLLPRNSPTVVVAVAPAPEETKTSS